MRHLIVSLIKTIGLFIFSFLALFVLYINLPVIFKHKNTCVYIYHKESFHQFSQDLAKQTQHTPAFIFKIYTRFTHLDRHLQEGEYCFSGPASIVKIMTKIGRANRELRKFTLVDGWTYEEMIAHLRQAQSLSDVLILDDKKTIASALQLSNAELEGQFYPNTYYYAYPDTALNILQEAHNAMTQRAQALYQESQAEGFVKNPYELLIVASIIQKEASDPFEQMLIAGIIANRLKLHMKLQMDPTVIYGLGAQYKTSLKKQDLKVESAYNTYLHFGLPPTPICMPGETALFAAAHPTMSDFLYYVSKKNNTHQFSKTLKEQNQAIKRYLLAPTDSGDKNNARA